MLGEDVSDDLLATLLAPPKPDIVVETKPCEFCGHCEHPGRCVWSIECPLCGVLPTEMCRKVMGGIDSFHEERWDHNLQVNGIHYRRELCRAPQPVVVFKYEGTL